LALSLLPPFAAPAAPAAIALVAIAKSAATKKTFKRSISEPPNSIGRRLALAYANRSGLAVEFVRHD
jgi:hypothetical protein